MEQSEKQAFWRFAVRYNGLLLGGLYFALLGLGVLAAKARMKGEMVHDLQLVCLLLLLIAFGSWLVCIRKSWVLTNFDHSLRVATMAYLFGAPFILTFVTLDIIEMILLLTRL